MGNFHWCNWIYYSGQYGATWTNAADGIAMEEINVVCKIDSFTLLDHLSESYKILWKVSDKWLCILFFRIFERKSVHVSIEVALKSFLAITTSVLTILPSEVVAEISSVTESFSNFPEAKTVFRWRLYSSLWYLLGTTEIFSVVAFSSSTPLS